ncbi:hypothetical protein L3Q82_011551 [Scortum barcoo]|uniref:Uncharacterized protein n=1 Tax=Scortum barcoo TaxID=214431 RepID=A0ACB8W5W4_9TELE|nr:hypothetical protein L3Q82_011551 [Scortum barcoo]
MESQSRSTIKYPSQGLQEGRVLCTAVRPSMHKQQQETYPQPDPKAQGSDPLVHRGELQHMAAELGSYKQAHTSPPPLTLGNSRVVEGPAPLKELGSRAQAMRGEISPTISSRYLSTSRTSSGSFPPSEVTFHVPIARVLVQRIGSSRPPATTDCYPNHIAPAPHGPSCGRPLTIWIGGHPSSTLALNIGAPRKLSPPVHVTPHNPHMDWSTGAILGWGSSCHQVCLRQAVVPPAFSLLQYSS